MTRRRIHSEVRAALRPRVVVLEDFVRAFLVVARAHLVAVLRHFALGPTTTPDAQEHARDQELVHRSIFGRRDDRGKSPRHGLSGELRATLLAIEDPAILSQFARSKFIPAKNADYGPIEEVGKLTNLLN